MATDRNYRQMFNFIKKVKVSKNTFYHAVFFDNGKFAEFSEYPITAMYFEESQSRHIIATFCYNPQNNFKEFKYYEKNKFESVAKILK